MLVSLALWAALCLSSGAAQVTSTGSVDYDAHLTSHAQTDNGVISQLNDLRRAVEDLTRHVTSVASRQAELSDRVAALSDRLSAAVQRQEVTAVRLESVSDQVGNLSGYVGELGQPRLRLGDRCWTDDDCAVTIRHSRCRQPDGVCTCGEDAMRDGDRRCRPYPRLSQACEWHHQCTHFTAHAVCAGGVCECGPGFWNREDQECRALATADEVCTAAQGCSASPFCAAGRCRPRECALVTASGLQYKLVGGHGPLCSDGLLQTRHAGRWRQLCDAGEWSAADASVACTQLGFNSSAAVSEGQYGFGRRSRARVLRVTCTGAEDELDQCGQTLITDSDQLGCPEDTSVMAVDCLHR